MSPPANIKYLIYQWWPANLIPTARFRIDLPHGKNHNDSKAEQYNFIQWYLCHETFIAYLVTKPYMELENLQFSPTIWIIPLSCYGRAAP